MVRSPDPTTSAAPGLLGSIRGLADGLLEAAQERVELFSTELREEKYRAIQLFIWITAAIFAAMLAITFASLTIVYLFWETARLAVLSGFAVVYTGVFVAILLYCRQVIARQSKPFESTLAELQQDRACIRPLN